MGKSDDYIDFKAYIGYLGKVTGRPADAHSIRESVLSKAAGRTEMQTAHLLLKRLSVIVVAIVLAAFCVACYAYLKYRPETEDAKVNNYVKK